MKLDERGELRTSDITRLKQKATSLNPAMHPLPRTPAEWLNEIADAYADAHEALPYMQSEGIEPDESLLFHMAPRVALKFRGLPEQQAEAVTEAALCSYIASKEQVGVALDDPHIAFAFCYLAAQFGPGIVSEQSIHEVMAFIEENDAILARAIIRRTRTKQQSRRPRRIRSTQNV
ncbi:MAG: hypothetical protein Q8O52_17645 [Sulfuritalea sp.]|nr:hypothetical protein [Sulfuritalea sp.]